MTQIQEIREIHKRNTKFNEETIESGDKFYKRREKPFNLDFKGLNLKEKKKT